MPWYAVEGQIKEERMAGIMKNKALIGLVAAFAVLIVVGVLTS